MRATVDDSRQLDTAKSPMSSLDSERVQYWHTRNLAIANRSRKAAQVTEMTFKGNSTSSKMSRFDRTHMISC